MKKIGDIIACSENRNFEAGMYVTIGGGISVTRNEAKKEMESLTAPQGFTLFVTTYRRGEGHFVVQIPDDKVKDVN